jgi:hypothetical protein
LRLIERCCKSASSSLQRIEAKNGLRRQACTRTRTRMRRQKKQRHSTTARTHMPSNTSAGSPLASGVDPSLYEEGPVGSSGTRVVWLGQRGRAGRGGRVERRSSLYRLLGGRTRRDGRLASVAHVGGGRTRLLLSGSRREFGGGTDDCVSSRAKARSRIATSVALSGSGSPAGSGFGLRASSGARPPNPPAEGTPRQARPRSRLGQHALRGHADEVLWHKQRLRSFHRLRQRNETDVVLLATVHARVDAIGFRNLEAIKPAVRAPEGDGAAGPPRPVVLSCRLAAPLPIPPA